MRFLNWLKGTFSPRQEPAPRDLRQTGSHLRQTGKHRTPAASKPEQTGPRSQPEFVDVDSSTKAKIADNRSGKNTLFRNKYVREETGTHETLKILDDSIIETDEETGLDPYNSGQFDRSKNWDSRFRK
jgi:hypothetical protein